MPIPLKMTSSGQGNMNVAVNMGGGPNLIQRSLFSTNTPYLAYANYYVPGSGSPAISTSDYYQISGLYWCMPYDLDAMGSEGAAIKAREGFRYVWMMGADHPGNTNFQASQDFYVGYSSDPQIWPSPTTVRMLLRQNTVTTLVDQNGTTQVNWGCYQIPFLVYNPDSAGDKFYIYAESNANGFQHELGLFTTSDFITCTLVGPAIPTVNFSGWTSFGRPQRLGVNDWIVYSFGKPDGSATNAVFYKYTSTDGWAWTPDFSTIVAGPGPFTTISGQDYYLSKESGATNDYVALLAVNANKVSLGTYVRISTEYGSSVGNGTSYPGPTYLQDVQGYEEDGVMSIYATRGYFPSGSPYQLSSGPFLNLFPTFVDVTASITSNVMDVTAIAGTSTIAVGNQLLFLSGSPSITSLGTGTGGLGTYNVSSTPNRGSGTITLALQGGLWHEFIDLYFYITNPAAAAGAAPLGVTADCTSGTVTVSWNDCLPNRTYRVYRGTSAASQPTLVGDVTGISITDTPTVGSQYFYKVVTLNAGVEQKNRVVSVYVSNNSQIVNRHVNRVINDGGDSTKIDMTFLASVDSYLSSNDYYKYLMYWVDVRFGVKFDGSGFISKIYCLGTTRLPRGGDFTPTTSNTWPSTSSNTSYSTTSFRGTTPSWINNTGSARGYFGSGRGNNIQRKNELTLIAAYQKPSTSVTAVPIALGEGLGFYLRHPTGSSGNVTFGLTADIPPSTYTTATVAFASGTAAHIMAGTFDGTNMICYLDGVAGTPVSASGINNPSMTKDTYLRGQYSTTSGQGPVLVSGSLSSRQNYSPQTYNMANSDGNFTGACMIVFEKGMSSTVISQITAMYA